MSQDKTLHGVSWFSKGSQIFGTVVSTNYARSFKKTGRSTLVHPGMIQHHFSGVSLTGILNQQMIYEVFCLLWDICPLATRKVVSSILDASEQLILTVLTEFTSLPATVTPCVIIIKTDVSIRCKYRTAFAIPNTVLAVLHCKQQKLNSQTFPNKQLANLSAEPSYAAQHTVCIHTSSNGSLPLTSLIS